MCDTWRRVETSTGETDQGVTILGMHTWLSGVPALEFRDEAWVQDVPSGDPAPLLQAITLPVNQVLETPAPWPNPQEASHRIAGWPSMTRGEGWA